MKTDTASTEPAPVVFHGRTISPEDLPDHEKGRLLANALGLRVIRSGENAGRYVTDWGTKTPAGLTRTIRHILNS